MRHYLATWGNRGWVGLESPMPTVPTMTWVCDSGCEIDGCRFWGSPWSLPFFDYAFMAAEADLETTWSRIPDDADVVIVHGPPLGIGDLTRDGLCVGSASLKARLTQIRPQLAVFGHIHEAAGQWDVAGAVWANVCLVDFHVQLVRAPRVFSVEPALGA